MAGIRGTPFKQVWKYRKYQRKDQNALEWVSSFLDSPQPMTLSPHFYSRDTLRVAQDLLGKILVVCDPKKSLKEQTSELTMARIVETEAYHGQDGTDPAAHSARGPTERNKIMFGDPGFAYVYFIYGMYEMLNFVTEPRDYPGAVLIRAAEPVWGQEVMKRRRKTPQAEKWTRGPGRLTRTMGIQMSHNGESLQGPALYVCEDGVLPRQILCSPRVGIAQGGEHYWRFFVKDSGFVSSARENKLAQPVRRRSG